MRFAPVFQLSWITALLLPASAGAADRARDARKIVDAYIRAEGGSKRLAQQQSVEFQGTVTDAASKQSGSFTLILERPNRLYHEITIGGQTSREAYNGKSAWREDTGGLRTLTGVEGKALETEARLRNQRFVAYKNDKDRVQLLGIDNVQGRPAQKVEVVTGTNLRWQVYFDESSHLISEEAVPKAGDDSSARRIFYDDYRTVDGIPEPFRIEYQQEDNDWVVTISRVSHNAAVQETVFAFPSRTDRPLPDIAELLKAVDRNQKAIEKLVEQYTCDKTDEEFEVDSQGQLRSKDVKVYNVFYLDGDEVDRLVSKNGKPLSPAEEQKENEHIQKVVKEYEKKQTRKAEHPNDRKEVKKNNDDLQVSDFLRLVSFTNPRRETFRGHEVIVFDFEPNPSYKPKSMVESLIHQLTGAVWIDEQAQDAVRLEAYMNGKFKLAGGLLASLSKGSAFTFEQSKVNDEVWMPSYLEAHINARLLLLKGMEGNFIERYSNYRKFHVDSLTQPGTVKGE